jgi:hypothetical protein
MARTPAFESDRWAFVAGSNIRLILPSAPTCLLACLSCPALAALTSLHVVPLRSYMMLLGKNEKDVIPGSHLTGERIDKCLFF